MMLVLKFVLGALLLGLVLTRVPFDQLRAAMDHLTPMSVGIAVALYFAAHAVNAVKLRVLLPGLSLWQAWRFTMIGVLFGTALPGQVAGDAVKAFRLARAAVDVGDVTAAVAAVAVDKVIGLFALLVLTAIGIGMNAGVFGNAIVSAAVVVTVLAPVTLLALIVLPLPPRLGRWAAAFIAWRDVTLGPATLLRSLALGLVFQALSILVFAVLGRDLGISLDVTIWAVIVGLISVVLMLPITVAGLGLRDGSLVAVLSLLGQAQGAALALSLSLLVLNLLGAGVGLVVDLAGQDK